MTAVRLPAVAVLSLGGTISSTGGDRPDGGVTSRLGAADLVGVVPQLADVATLTAVTFRSQASSDLTLPDLVELAAAIDRELAAGAAGVVVTQGTDTLEETSFALELLVRAAGTVVLTGAMRNPTVPGHDGPANLLAAVQVAASPAARGQGVLVVMNDEIHTARYLRKGHTASPAAFGSPTLGPVGWLSEGQVRIAARVPALPPVTPGAAMPAVALLTAALGDDLRLVGRLEDCGYAGLVVEGLGGGHVPSRSVAGLADLATRLPVVLASRTGGGELLRQTYGFAGSERDLLARGLIAAGFLDGRKARVLTTLLLSAGRDVAGVRAAFDAINATALGVA